MPDHSDLVAYIPKKDPAGVKRKMLTCTPEAYAWIKNTAKETQLPMTKIIDSLVCYYNDAPLEPLTVEE